MRSEGVISSLAQVLVACFLFGCASRDAEKCEQALQVTRQSMERGDFAPAQQWREYAWKQCEDRPTLEALDKQLANRRAEFEAVSRAAEARRRETTEVLKVFLNWVAQNKNAPDRASASPTCDPPAENDPKQDKSTERLCTATRAAGSHQLLARYWGSQPTLARFTVALPDATTCEEIGAAKVLKNWQVAATQGRSTSRFRCEFVSGPLSGMHAVLSQAVNANFHVFNPAYLDKEPGFRPLLDGP